MQKAAAVLIAAATLLAAGFAVVAERSRGLVVHEWGTFTTVAGLGGEALAWRPLERPDPLPSFVGTIAGRFKGDLTARVRMETPVVYFYSDRDVDAAVRVGFPGGRITEWFPAAAVGAETIAWPLVRVRPDSREVFPFSDDDDGSHYYRARDTDAAPLEVPRPDGASEHEKFLFYRGAGDFPVPLRARLDAGSGSVAIENACDEPIGGIFVFEREGDRVSFTEPFGLGPRGGTAVARPAAPRDFEDLFAALRASLVAAGLFEREARAMVETWRDEWFEEGLRCLYLVPRAVTDAVLPIEIEPAPASLERVLVGRIEIVTPREVRALAGLAQRLESADDAERGAAWNELREAHGRFAEPVLRVLRQARDRARLNERIAAYSAEAR